MKLESISMNDRYTKKQELKALLSIFYQSGSLKQARLFPVDDIEEKELKAFSKLINKESKKHLTLLASRPL